MRVPQSPNTIYCLFTEIKRKYNISLKTVLMTIFSRKSLFHIKNIKRNSKPNEEKVNKRRK